MKMGRLLRVSTVPEIVGHLEKSLGHDHPDVARTWIAGESLLRRAGTGS
jgi:hypothetical protein